MEFKIDDRVKVRKQLPYDYCMSHLDNPWQDSVGQFGTVVGLDLTDLEYEDELYTDVKVQFDNPGMNIDENCLWVPSKYLTLASREVQNEPSEQVDKLNPQTILAIIEEFIQKDQRDMAKIFITGLIKE